MMVVRGGPMLFAALAAAPLLGCDRIAGRVDPVPTACEAPSSGAEESIALEPLFDGFKFRKPVQVLARPGGVRFVVEHEGRILRIGPSTREVELDIRDRVLAGQQWGLQSVAISPADATGDRLYVAYTAPSDRGAALQSRVSVFERRGEEGYDPESERVLLSEEQLVPWHPIAALRFGPDGMLYVGWGEGAVEKWEFTDALRGKFLRIDVSRASAETGYRIPADNPFADGPLRPEVFAAGLRNPWRFSFHPESGDIWVGDVGGRLFEEINRVVPGGHHGWPFREGFECIASERCGEESVDPVLVHSIRSFCAIIGGFVYRGTEFPDLRGRYLYADACSRSLYALDIEDGTTRLVQRFDTDVIGALDEDSDGEILLVETRDHPDDPAAIEARHGVFKLRARAAEVARDGGQGEITLRSLGCVATGGATVPPPGMVTYRPASPAWDGGLEALRFVSEGFGLILTAEEPLTGAPKIHLKTLFSEGRPIESQMLSVSRSGQWRAYGFAWNEAGTDAVLVREPRTVDLGSGRTWALDTAPACMRCHSESAGRVLGLDLRQLSSRISGREDSQLEQWLGRGLLESAVAHEELLEAVRERPSLVDASDASASLEDRARSYLHVNCGSCHRPGGNARMVPMDLTRDVPLEEMGVCGKAPSADYPGLPNVMLVDPGRPGNSLLYLRTADGDALAMPPGRAADPVGAALVARWIAELSACGVVGPAGEVSNGRPTRKLVRTFVKS